MAQEILTRRYFFDLIEGDNRIQDTAGALLSSDAHARDRVMTNVQDVISELNPAIVVTSELGRVVFATSFRNASKSSWRSRSAVPAHPLQKREAMLVQTEMLSRVGGWELDLRNSQLYWTDGTFRIFDLVVGVPPAYRAILLLFSPTSRVNLTRAIIGAIRDFEKFDIELETVNSTDRPRWVRVSGECQQTAGIATRIFGFVADITTQKLAQQISWSQANQDALTGLSNRARFQRQLADALDRAKHEGRRVALILLDLDNLKVVNDTHGHAAGDQLLRRVGDLLQSFTRPGDSSARIGGDEFAIVRSDLESGLEIVAFVERIQAKLRADTWDAQLSAGIAIYPDHDEDPDSLLNSADIALYAAKAAGRGALTVFSPEMRLSLLKKVAALESARNGLRQDRFIPFYQPLVSLVDGTIVGFEALLRWDHPDKGLLLPEVLKHAFEDSELARAIGVVMLTKTIANIRAWTERGYILGRVGINVTPLELSRAQFASQFLKRVSSGGVSADTLEIEVTEDSLAGRGSEIISANLHELSAAGISIALDDFGTGFGSLIHLRQMPINTLKIDRSFIRDMDDDPHAKAIVCALIKLANSLQIKVVAEGVETQPQADFLSKEGCDRAQGFLFSPALPSHQIAALLGPQAVVFARTKE